MQSPPSSASKILHPTVALSAADMAQLLDVKEREIVQLRRQIAWFQRQIFGQKSERRVLQPDGVQGSLGESFEVVPADLPAPNKSRIAAHEREHKNKNGNGNPIDCGDDSALFFDDARVPVEVIAVPNQEAAGLDPADYEVIGEKVSDRLAQRPGSYVILKYVRRVIKVRTTQTPSCPPAPVGVINGCRADVSFIAGMIIGKFAYHQPLYRQHVKLRDAGINVSHAWLTKLMPAAVSMLEPIFNAQLDFVRRSRVIAMDETPIKAGRAGGTRQDEGGVLLAGSG